MANARSKPRVKGNRLVRAQRVAAHGGSNDMTTHFYYGGVAAGLSTGRWNVFETRNGSNQATRQWVYGACGTGMLPVSYVDQILFMDVNGDPATDNDCDQDVLTRPEDQACQAPCTGGDGDRRYFYVQDRNWNVVALTAYCSPGLGCNTSNATIVERYSYTPYGEFVVLGGAGDSGEWANARATSSVGNIFFHQGLPIDLEKGSCHCLPMRRPASLCAGYGGCGRARGASSMPSRDRGTNESTHIARVVGVMGSSATSDSSSDAPGSPIHCLARYNRAMARAKAAFDDCWDGAPAACELVFPVMEDPIHYLECVYALQADCHKTFDTVQDVLRAALNECLKCFHVEPPI